MTKSTRQVSEFRTYTVPELITYTQDNLPVFERFLTEKVESKKKTNTQNKKIKKMKEHLRTLQRYRQTTPTNKNLTPNERQKLENALTYFKKMIDETTKEKQKESEISGAKLLTPSQRKYWKSLSESDLVLGEGPAGTGKTYLAVRKALELFSQHKIKRIFITRPAVPAKEDIGFLPGDIKDKMDPFLRPIFDAFQDCGKSKKDIEEMLENGTLEIVPLGFMRGRTLKNAVIILDEAQNTTDEQMFMFVTRAGDGAKVFINGDPTQSDLRPNQESGLAYLSEVLTRVAPRDDVKISVVHFEAADVVRSPLVEALVPAFESLNQERETAIEKKPVPPRSLGENKTTIQITAENVIVKGGGK